MCSADFWIFEPHSMCIAQLLVVILFFPVHCSAINSRNTLSNISWSHIRNRIYTKIESMHTNETWNETYEKKRNYRYIYVNGCKIKKKLLREYKIAFCNDRMSWPLLHNLKHKEFNSTVVFFSALFHVSHSYYEQRPHLPVCKNIQLRIAFTGTDD